MAGRSASYLVRCLGLTSALAALSWPLAILAQGIPEDEGGARATAGIDLRLELDDGDPEFRTGFNLDLITATRTQSLQFSGDFGLTVPLDDIEATAFNDPTYDLSYVRDTGRSRLSFSVNFSEIDIDSLRTLEDDAGTIFDESTLIVSEEGSRERLRTNVGLELGLNDPIGGEIRYRYDDTFFTNVTDPDLEDTRIDEFSGSLRLDVDRVLSFSLDGQWQRTQTIGTLEEDEVRTRLGGGFEWQARPALSLDGSIAYARIATDTTNLGVTSREERDGINVAFGADLSRPNGSYSFDLDRTLNTIGFVTTVEVGRQFDLPRGASISAMIGATELPNGEVFPIGSFNYDRDTANGNLGFSLSRSAAVNDDDEAVERTILTGSYQLDLPRDAGLSLSGRLTESDFTLATDPDISSMRLSLNYNRPLTEDWGLGAGLSRQLTREDGIGDEIDNILFLSLERRFTFRR